MKKNYKLKKIIISSIIVILSLLLLYSTVKIIKWMVDSNKANNQIKDLQKNTPITNRKDSKNTEIFNQNENIPKTDPYWDYIKMDMMNVDFSKLKKTNKDVIGWIKLNGTNINYPFVQTNNNKYYLTHSFDKTYNSAGWVFLDYRNNGINNKNTIIYAHGRTDETMFGSLKKVLTKKWFNNKENHIIKISTETENTLWQIFSVYRIPTTNDYLQTEFNSDDEYQRFIDMLLKRSSYNFNSYVNEKDNIVTLSTCYNNSDKLVVHAKLIKKEKRKM